MNSSESRLMHQPGAAILRGEWNGIDTQFIFLEPYESFVVRERSSILELDKWICKQRTIQRSTTLPHLAGYFTYEFLHCIESIPAAATDVYKLPLASFHTYRKVIAVNSEGSFPEVLDTDINPLWEASEVQTQYLLDSLKTAESIPETMTNSDLDLPSWHSNFNAQEYVHAVEGIREMILDGKVYQANISQQITLPGYKDPWRFFTILCRTERAPQSAFVSCGTPDEPIGIVSNSPELFFSVSGDELRMAPIKGTSARGNTERDDVLSGEDLLRSEKNRAELAMIVDLVRNDMGRICLPGTIQVEAFPKLMALRFIYHLFSPIRGTLAEKTSLIEIFKALFPSGSVTGAPKVAAMQCIAALEKTTRGPYCGAIGWIGHDSASFNVAIRTGLVSSNRCVFQAGGGVTIDSVGIDEYKETLQKAHAFLYTYSKL